MELDYTRCLAIEAFRVREKRSAELKHASLLCNSLYYDI
jgi:hypothetical protein